MGKINGCLKGLFIYFNIKFAIIGGVLIFLATRSSNDGHELMAVSSPRMEWIWMLAIGILSISCLGIHASISEKEITLKIFAGFTGAVLIIMLIFGIVTVVERNKFESNFDSAAVEVAKSLKEDEKLRTLLEELQQDSHCCGVVSASDWGDNIPNSCKCSGYGYRYGYRYEEYGGYECKSKPQGVSGPDRIYAQPCGKSQFVRKDADFGIATGMCFGFTFIPLLDLLFSLLMIHQVRRHDGRIFHFYEVILRTPLTPNP